MKKETFLEYYENIFIDITIYHFKSFLLKMFSDLSHEPVIGFKQLCEA